MEAVVSDVVAYLLRVVVATVGHILILLGPCLLLASLMSVLAGSVRLQTCRWIGLRAYLALFGWLGTSIHELGHVVFLMIFGHQITEVKLFAPDLRTGTLGYVRANYNPHSLYQRIGMFFASIGPIIFGTLVIYASYLLLVQPDIPYLGRTTGSLIYSSDHLDFAALTSDISQSSSAILASLFTASNLLNWKFYLFVYISFAVGSSIQLSRADIEGGIAGFQTFVAFVFLFNLGTIWLGDFANQYAVSISQLYGFFYAMMAFVLILNVLAATLLYIIVGLTRTR